MSTEARFEEVRQIVVRQASALILDVQPFDVQFLNVKAAHDGLADGQPAHRQGSDGARTQRRGTDRERPDG